MTERPVTWVLGDHATHPEAPDDALRLTLGGEADSMSLGITGLEDALSGQVPPRFLDLIRISTFAFAADGAVSRGHLDDEGEHWHRSLRLVLGVDDPDFWNHDSVRKPIEQTLGFLSQDSFHLDFQPREQKPPRQLTFAGPEGGPVVSWDDIQDVALFSGGLDSFAGAADLILRQRRGVALVSHQSSTKIMAVQKSLFLELRRKAKEHGCPEPIHVVINVRKHVDSLRKERTHRTRSFLYACVAGAVAHILNRDRITAPESGIIGINLPVAHSVVGARGTRTAHPRVLVGFGKVLSAISGRTVTVNNPFALMTRAEVIKTLGQTPALDLAKQTISCAHVHLVSKMSPHCGTCSQCIDRQFGFLASGLAQHDSELGYEVRLAQDQWKKASDRDLLFNWIRAASNFAELKNGDDFVASNGDAARSVPFIMTSQGLGPEDAQHAVFDLHRRHGQQVLQALEALKPAVKKLKASTLASLLWPRAESTRSAKAPETNQFRIENRLVFGGSDWKMIFRNGAPIVVPDSLGLQYLCVLLQNPGRVFPAAALHDSAMGRQPRARPEIDSRGREVIRSHIIQLEQARSGAQDVGDDADASRCQAQIDSLRDLLNQSMNVRGERSRSACAAVETEIKSCLKQIKGACLPFFQHLVEHTNIGSVVWYRHGTTWIVKGRPTVADAPDSEWVPVKSLVRKDHDFLRQPREVSRFCDHQGVPTKPAKTKAGKDNPQRRMVHRPSFESALAKFRREKRNLEDVADRVHLIRETKGRK